MQNITGLNITTELYGIGFEKVFVNKLLKVVKSESDFSKLQLFIMETDGQYRSQMSLVAAFIQHMLKLRMYNTYEQFYADYLSDQKSALDRLFVTHLNESQVDVMYELINVHDIELYWLFSEISKYRLTYSVDETLTLLKFHLNLL